jgi:hypothetical protein
LVLRTNLLIFKETAPIEAIEYKEKDFLTPEGSLTRAVWVFKSSFMKRPEEPADLIYCIPAPGYSSIKETFDKTRILIKTPIDESKSSKLAKWPVEN